MIVRELITKLGFSVDESSVKKYDGMMSGIKKAGLALGAIGSMAGLATIGKLADEMTNAYTRVGIAAGTDRQAEMWEKIYQVAQDTRQPLEDVANTYGKIGRNAKDLGINQDEALRVAELMNKAFVESGASTQEAKSAILQMGQALSSGVLQGDEFRAITENAPLVADAIAKGMGIARSELKKASSEGKLTSKEVVKAILSQGAALDAEFTKFPMTIGQGLTIGKNLFAKFISDIDRQTKFSNKLATAFVTAFKKIDNEVRYAITWFGGFDRALRKIVLAVISFGIVAGSRFLIARMAVVGVTKALVILRGALMALVARFALVYGLVLILEDIYAWVTNNDSLIGQYMGSWENFTNKFQTWFDTVILARLKAMKDYVDNLIKTVDDFWNKVSKGKPLPEGFGGQLKMLLGKDPNDPWFKQPDRPFTPFIPPQFTPGVTNSFSFNMPVPAGTTAQQAGYLQGATQKSAEVAFESLGRDVVYG